VVVKVVVVVKSYWFDLQLLSWENRFKLLLPVPLSIFFVLLLVLDFSAAWEPEIDPLLPANPENRARARERFKLPPTRTLPLSLTLPLSSVRGAGDHVAFELAYQIEDRELSAPGNIRVFADFP
jgi:hypothetical protein